LADQIDVVVNVAEWLAWWMITQLFSMR